MRVETGTEGVEMTQKKTADMVVVGDIIVTRDKGEHLVLKVKHSADETRLRTVDIATGEPKTRIWKHTRSYSIDTALSTVLAA